MFNNIILEIIVEKEVPVVIGSKLCGRYGDKGVVSVIEKDENMPIFDGKPVECVVDINGVGGRLNPGQLIEIELNFLGDEIRKYMKEADDKNIKEWYLFEFLKEINEDGYNKLIKWYNDLSYEDQVEFLHDCEVNNIYKEQPAMFGNAGLKEIMNVYDRFNIKPRSAYIKRFGKKVKIMNDVVIGEKYIVKLKHHPKSKFATRSTGFINSKDQPTKTSSAKQSKSICVQTPVKWGDMEILNLLMNNNPKVLTKLIFLYSSSPMARKDVAQLYENGVTDNIEINKDAANRNVEILNVILKAKGIGMRFKKKNKK